MPYLDLLGHATYHEIHGDGEPVLLLHGGYATLENLRPLGDALAATHRGARAEADRALAYLDAVGLESAHVGGFSDGAIIGLMLALDHPTRVRSLVAISGNIDPGGFVSDEEAEHTMTAEAAALVEPRVGAFTGGPAGGSGDGPD